MIEPIKANIREMVTLIGEHLYTKHKDVVFRELIQNAYDSIQLRFHSEAVKKGRIDITVHKSPLSIEIADNGIGMDDQDLRKYLSVLGQTAKTVSYSKRTSIIGEYGIGFFSAYMVSDNITVKTKKINTDTTFAWRSVGTGDYEIGETSEDSMPEGTVITLILQRSSARYAEETNLRKIIKRYCDYLDCGIFLNESSDPVNVMKFPWEVSNRQSQERMIRDHFSGEPRYFTLGAGNVGNTHFNYAISISERVDKYLDLFCKRMFVTNDLLIFSRTLNLNFVDLILNCDQFSLDLSREAISQDRTFRAVAENVENFVLKWFRRLLKENPQDTHLIGIVKGRQADFRKLCLENREFFDRLHPYLLFKLSDNESSVTIDEYSERWQGFQGKVVYASNERSEYSGKQQRLLLLVAESHKVPVILTETREDEELLRRICNKGGFILTKIEEYDLIKASQLDDLDLESVSRCFEAFLGKTPIISEFEPEYLPILVHNDHIVLNKRSLFLRTLGSVNLRPERLRPVYFVLERVFNGIDKVMLDRQTSKAVVNPIIGIFEKWIDDIQQSEKDLDRLGFLCDDWWVSPPTIEVANKTRNRFYRDGKQYSVSCFIVCPFKPAYKDVENVIKDVCGSYDIYAETAGEISNKAIFEKICVKINDCDFAIVDISENNPNVMLELGILIARRKPAIIIRDKEFAELVEMRVPSDIIGIERLEYSNTSEDLFQKLQAICGKVSGAIVAQKSVKKTKGS